MRALLLLVTTSIAALAESLPNTKPLEMQGDIAAQMVNGIITHLTKATRESVPYRRPSAARLRKILGVVDERVAFQSPRLLATVDRPAVVLENAAFRVSRVSWPVLQDGITAEGLLFEPGGKVSARVVALPDADQLPEQMQAAQRLAASGCVVLVPVLIDRSHTYSGNPRFRMTNQPHREYIYRMAFLVGRHIIGYEIQKALAAVDWFAAQRDKLPIGIAGYGEGGAVALFAAALDDRITATLVSGYFEPREDLPTQPLYRNVFGLLKDFGDAELASMISPRTLIIETEPGPSVAGPSTSDSSRRGAAPGILVPVSVERARLEVARAMKLSPGARIQLASNGTTNLIAAINGRSSGHVKTVAINAQGAEDRQRRQFSEMVEQTQRFVDKSESVRNQLWAKTDRASLKQWNESAPALRERFWEDVIGKLPDSAATPLNPRTRRSYSGAAWEGYEVVYDVVPDVIGYGVLLVPKNIVAGERRPAVVAQHGLDGRPQDLFSQPEVEDKDGKKTNFHYYQNIGSKLAELGYVVYMPQNPYIGDFRPINRFANPLGLSLFSFIISQHDRLLAWMSSLPYVDAKRIGFYGLSYGGKTAVRVPPLVEGYALSICSGDFNEWVRKVTTVDAPYTYMLTHEWEIPEFDLASVANHAEMAKMMAPRPFMVERGHRDGVGVDEWVAYEYAKVKRFYDEMGIGDRTDFEYFNGPHKIHGKGTIDFLRKHLGR
ncbi:MAG: dienelactone hydrolase family protein [Bryobacteraceae bacterium]